MKHLLLIIALTGCGQLPGHDKKSESHGEPLSYEFLSTRLLSRFVENGYVVSRHLSGDPDYSGERLLWSGITLDAMYCGKEVNMTLLQLQALGIPNQDSKIICALTMAGEH